MRHAAITIILALALIGPAASLAQAQTQAQTSPHNGCFFQSSSGGQVAIYKDTAISDEGDFVAEMTLKPRIPSSLVTVEGKGIRYWFRASRTAAWQKRGWHSCKGGEVIHL